MKRKRLTTATVTIAVLALAAWLAVPTLIGRTVKGRAKDRGWDIQFQSLSWNLSSVTLRSVVASNAWLRAELDEVTLSVDGTEMKAVQARGGKATVDLSKRPKGESKGSSLKTSAEGVDVEVTGLCGSGKAQAKGAGKDEDGSVWAEKANGTCRGWTAETESVRKTGPTVTAGRVVLKRIGESKEEDEGGEQALSGEGLPIVRVADLTVEADGKFVRAKGAEVSVRPDGVEVEADSVSAEVSAEVGPVTATRVRGGIDRKTHQFTLGAATMNASMDAVSKDRLEALTIMVWGRITRKDGMTVVDDVLVKVGKASLSGWLRYKDRKNFEALGFLSKVECQAIIESAPKGFMDMMAGFKYSGTVSSELTVSGKDGKFDVKLDLKNGCKADTVPDAMSVKAFSRKFKRTVPGMKGDIEVESGLGSDRWTPLDRVSPYMVKAVMTTEDTGFFVHRGIVPQSIANSMKENLEKGQFARGGSTVTMQLAKNLWLSRTKTISRKAQEFFLTTYLEQSMTKQEIMELYLNVIEFGPGVYGIRHAADYYFGKSPLDLTVGEAAFLASILPSPKREHFSKEGALKDGWDEWVKSIVRLMRKRDLISEQEEAEGLKEAVTKGVSQTGGLSPVNVLPGGVDPKTWH